MGIMRESTAYKIFPTPRSLMSHQHVLNKLLAKKKLTPASTQQDEALLVQEFLAPQVAFKKKARAVGRPAVEHKLKARNFTVCMATNYIKFLDSFKPPIKKIQGRGRKLRFIIDEFIRMSKRQREQLKYLQEALQGLSTVLSSFSGAVKKGEMLCLTPKEKQLISTHVNRVKLLTQLLCFSPTELKKILPSDDWNLYSFCLHWNNK